MAKNLIKSIYFKVMLLFYVVMMTIFYPVSRMYADEYVTRTIKFEFAFFMAIIAIISNHGILIIVFEKALKFKKVLCLSITVSVLMNTLLLFITNGNPLSSISNENWMKVRYLSFYTILVLGIFLCLLVGKYQNEDR